ncbi:MAG: 23S rRNA (pseudouridine(1915)-N(3))-methyltransferase RlmH [Firmicutes bacterium]|nr:23S rRNA (pseudouridine(1915)-N(3))-methyltransferase RlmH [Bacillota bacterium]
MLAVTVYAVGTLKEAFLRDAVAEYSKRLSGYCSFSVRECADGKPLPPFPKKAYRIALCVEGKMMSSEALAHELETLPLRGVSEVVFVIGGENGLDESVKAACDLRLSFSPMTFPHQLMRVILCEQIYRAFTIINHGKYHK